MSGQKKSIGFKFNEEQNSAEWELPVREEKNKEIPIPEGFDKIIEWIKKNFESCREMKDADSIFTTAEIFEMLQQHLPSDGYTAENVYQALEQAGFSYYSAGDLNFVWLLKRKAP